MIEQLIFTFKNELFVLCFQIEPIILILEPKTLGYVTFSLDRTKELSINRNEKNNIVNGKAVGIVTALEPSGYI